MRCATAFTAIVRALPAAAVTPLRWSTANTTLQRKCSENTDLCPIPREAGCCICCAHSLALSCSVNASAPTSSSINTATSSPRICARLSRKYPPQSFDRFFDQYVFHAHHPELKISYAWDEKTKLAKLSVQQTQKVDANVMLFHVPVPIRFKVDGQIVDLKLQITKTVRRLLFPLGQGSLDRSYRPRCDAPGQVQLHAFDGAAARAVG